MCGLTYDLAWKMSHVPLGAVCVLLLGGVLMSGLAYSVKSSIFRLLSGFCIHYDKKDIKVSTYYFKTISPFSCVKLCFIYFNGLSLGM